MHRVTLVSEDRLGWHLSVDLTAPLFDSDEPLFVPLGIVPLRLLHEVDLVGPGGDSLPLVTRRYEYNLVAQAIITMWGELNGDVLPSQTIQDRICEVVWLRGEAAREAWEQLRPLLDATGQPADNELVDQIASLLLGLIDGGLICASVQSWDRGGRLILKLSYAVDKPLTRPGPWARLASRRLASSLGLMPDEVDIDAGDVGASCSVHYVVNAPMNLAFSDAFFARRDEKARLQPEQPDAVLPGSNQAHLYSPPHWTHKDGVPTATDEGSPIVVRLKMWLSPDGDVRRASSVGGWLAVAVLLAAVFLPLIQARAHSTEVGLFMLGGAAALSSFVAATVTSRISWRMFRIVRYLSVLTGAAVVGMGLLVLGVQPMTATPVGAFCTEGSNSVEVAWTCLNGLLTSGGVELGVLATWRWWLVVVAFVAPIYYGTDRLRWSYRRMRHRHAASLWRGIRERSQRLAEWAGQRGAKGRRDDGV